MGTRDRLLEVAAELFAAKGYDGTSIRDITTAAEANLGAITYHFGSKEGLFEAVIEKKVEPLVAILAEAASSSVSAKEKLSQVMRRMAMHILHRDPALKMLFVEAVHGGRRFPESTFKGLKRRNQVVGRIIQDGIDAGEFRPCDVECATWMFFATVIPYVMHQNLMKPAHREGPYPKRFVDHVVDTALMIFFEGLGART